MDAIFADKFLKENFSNILRYLIIEYNFENLINYSLVVIQSKPTFHSSIWGSEINDIFNGNCNKG